MGDLACSRRLPELIEAGRLALRRWVPSDAGILAATVERNLDHLRPWMPWVKDEPLTSERRLHLLQEWEQEWMGGGDVMLAMFLGEAAVGGCGLHRRVGPSGLEIGYWVDRDYLRQGMATESAAAMTTAAFGLPGLEFVEIRHDKANVRSSGVPRRLGYRLVGEADRSPVAPAETGVELRWRMDRDRWLDRGE